MTRSIPTFAYTVTPPFVPSGAITALAMVWPAEKFIEATRGAGCAAPSGQTEMNPIPLVLVTAMFADTAWAVLGMPQKPATGKTRGLTAIIEGGPNAPVKPFPRVSARRQGGIATKAIGGVGTAARTPAIGSEALWACASIPDETRHRSSRASRTWRFAGMHSPLGGI
jgi:hypothetical protein